MSETTPLRRKSTHQRRPTWRSLVVTLAATAVLCIYLFVNAPPPLAAEPAHEHTMPIRDVFAMLDRENAAARALWTQEIVARGTAAGLEFDEHWRDTTVQAGPLPALFLRETARNLERTSLRLSLFLGSPFPLNAANQFTGEQAKHFAALLQTGAPQHFIDPSTGRQTAMFGDVAVNEACVSCHNEHEGAPKSDWRLNEVMGATTWMYPDASVSTERAVELVRALRASIRRAYAAYLEKVASFPSPPQIGERWPRDGFALPSEDVFMRELARRSSTPTLLVLLDPELAATELDEPARATASPAPVATEAAPDAGGDTLAIRSAHATRVIVEQAGVRVLVARLVPGAVTTVSSRLPLRVQVDDPAGVDIKYGGKTVALPPREASAKSVEAWIGARDDEKW